MNEIITIFFVLSIAYYFILFNKQLELQKKQNKLLERILGGEKFQKNNNHDEKEAMPYTEIEKLKTEFMKNQYKPPKK
ncbi:MAG: hypothetical protein CMD65_03805 [Gammaproteobacteria bacterium]|nr:hypothetical protein [Gammaproteobacteria bacterium]|tara:strand:- start:620 stop:853 length:234 start_codon:yes stop_codon:yes gene_type:complete